MKSVNSQNLDGKVALVTGAGSGIGEASARWLAREGVKVGVLSRTASEIQKLAKEITEQGGEALALRADVGHESQMTNAVKRISQKWKRLDIVIANAGINGVWAPLDKLRVDEWDETIRINLRGTFLTIRSALPLLKKRGGSIVVIASVNGTRMFSNVGASAYATSKAAQTAFAKMLAVELAQYAIRVNVICPGSIDTEIDDNTDRSATKDLGPKVEYPEGKIPLTGHQPGKSIQVARLAGFLASDDADHISGTEIFLDGAQSLLQG